MKLPGNTRKLLLSHSLDWPPEPTALPLATARVWREKHATMPKVLLVCCSLACSPVSSLVCSFQPGVLATHTRRASVTMGLFDGAFANDPAYAKKQNAGLSKEATKRTVTWVNAQTGATKTAQAVAGQSLREVARGIPIKYDCREGICKTCLSSMGKICVTKMPNKDVTIKYGLMKGKLY